MVTSMAILKFDALDDFGQLIFALHVFAAALTSLRTVRCRTVANTLSIGFDPVLGWEVELIPDGTKKPPR